MGVRRSYDQYDEELLAFVASAIETSTTKVYTDEKLGIVRTDQSE